MNWAVAKDAFGVIKELATFTGVVIAWLWAVHTYILKKEAGTTSQQEQINTLKGRVDVAAAQGSTTYGKMTAQFGEYDLDLLTLKKDLEQTNQHLIELRRRIELIENRRDPRR